MALVSNTTERFLEQYNKQKLDSEKKYNNYLAKLKAKKSPKAKTIAGALGLLSRSRQPEAKKLFQGLIKRRCVILFDDLGSNRGWHFRPGVPDKRGVEKDAVIIIDSKYVNSAICTAGILAHEFKHIRDREKKVPGSFATPDAEELQDRADTYAGMILDKLGAKPGLPGTLSHEKIAELKKKWGPKWSLWYDDMNHKMNLYRRNNKKTPAKPRQPAKPVVEATHCNGHNHPANCTCGWGGPR